MKWLNLHSVLILILLFPVILTAQNPQYYNYYNIGAGGNAWPLAWDYGKACQWLFLPGDFNQPAPLPHGNQITKVYIFIVSAGNRTYTDLNILMAQDTNTTFIYGTFYSGTMDTVYYRSSVTLTGNALSWLQITLDNPFPYDPSRSLIVMVGQCAAAGSGMTIRQKSLSYPPYRRIWSEGGCPFTPDSYSDAAVVNFGVDIEPVETLIPDLLYYKFENSTPGLIQNCAYPGVGTNPAPYAVHTLVSGGQFDTCMSGTGGSNSGVSTGWQTNFGPGSWTMSMWLNDIPSNTTLYYLWGDPTGSFRCFLGGAAGAGNILFRGTGITDVNIPAVAPGPTVVHIVYDSASHTVHTYKNGVPSLSVVQATPFNFATGAGFKVGGYSTSAGLYGKIDEFRAYKRALSATDVANSWNVDLPCGIVTGTGKNNYSELPRYCVLFQNYPNPFNANTIIRFQIKDSRFVKLKVFDMLGREVATLVNEYLQPGTYEVRFDANDLPSGMYFYQLKTGSFTETKKLILIK